MMNNIKMLTKNMEKLPINMSIRAYWLFLFFLTSGMYMSSFCASSDQRETEPFYETSWSIEKEICTVYFYVPDKLEDKKLAVGEFIHRCMLDDHTREQGAQYRANSLELLLITRKHKPIAAIRSLTQKFSKQLVSQ